MSYKKATYITLAVFSIIGVVFFIMSTSFINHGGIKSVGPELFPQINSVLLIIACVLGAIGTFKKEDKFIKFEKLGLIIFTLVWLLIFVAIWKYAKAFYLSAFILIFGLVFVYNPNKEIKKKLINAFILSLSLNLFIFIVFEKVLSIRF